jgi:hypothetical protein
MSCEDDHELFVDTDLGRDNYGRLECTIPAFLFRERGNPHITLVRIVSVLIRGYLQNTSLEGYRYTNLLDTGLLLQVRIWNLQSTALSATAGWN